MNIFELLKHEKHDLEVIIDKESKEVFLGCMNCGKVLASSQDMMGFGRKLNKFKPNLTELNCDNLLQAFDRFEEGLVNLITHLAKNQIKENIVNYVNTMFDYLKEEGDEDDGVEIDLHSFLFEGSGIYDGILYDFESVYMDELFDKNFDRMKEELLELTYNEIIEHSNYKVLKKGESYVVSNYVIICDRSDYIVLNVEYIKKSEMEEPTVTNVLKFDNENDFAEYVTEEINRKEFSYRIHAGLIDISNLRKDLIVEALEWRIDPLIVNLLDLLINRS